MDVEGRRRVGVLLPVSTLGSIVRGQPTYEYATAYTEAAAKLGLEVVLFSLKGCDPQRGTVQGYVGRNGAWIPWTGPLPPVIHNRQLPGTARELQRVRRLEALLGRRFFNPLVARDKWTVWQQLAGSPTVKEHLPHTWPLTATLCRALPRLAQSEGGIVIKPRVGSWGLGIRFIEPLPDSRFRLVPSRGRIWTVSAAGLVRLGLNLRRLRLYIVQRIVPLVRYNNRRCDVRIPVQRDGRGRWTVLPGTVKQAVRHPYLTNIARGGRAYDSDTVLRAIFGPDRGARIGDAANGLALAVAEQLTRHYPALADLGLDIGIDPGGKPWLIEVNFRDQRLPAKEAGQLDTHARIYHNPIAYAHYLLTDASRAEPVPAGEPAPVS